MTRLMLLLSLLLVPLLTVAERRVAIFDYDQRTSEAPGIAPYLEQQLRARDPTLTLIVYSAEGDRRRAIELLDRLDSEGWDLIITITTDALQLALHRLRKTPFVFTNVNNPGTLGIEDRGSEDRRFTGASYYVPVRQQLEFFLQIQPDIRRLGFLFDPDNRSMQVEAREVRQACRELGIEFLYRRTGSGQSLALMAGELAAEGVDALVATSSDRIYLRIAEIEKGLRPHLIPIYSFNARGVEQGALAALASDHRAMVDQLVIPRVLALLSGHKSPAQLPVGYQENPQRYINTGVLERFGFKRPVSSDSGL